MTASPIKALHSGYRNAAEQDGGDYSKKILTMHRSIASSDELAKILGSMLQKKSDDLLLVITIFSSKSNHKKTFSPKTLPFISDKPL